MIPCALRKQSIWNMLVARPGCRPRLPSVVACRSVSHCLGFVVLFGAISLVVVVSEHMRLWTAGLFSSF